MRRTWAHVVGRVLALVVLFFARYIERPDTVAGATRGRMPMRAASSQSQESSADPQAFSSPTPTPTPVRKEAATSMPLDPGQILVSSTGPASSGQGNIPDLVKNNASVRTFEGKVESVVDEISDDGSRQVVVIVSTLGEHFKVILNSRTSVYKGDDRSPQMSPLSSGDQILVRYLPQKENLAVEVKID